MTKTAPISEILYFLIFRILDDGQNTKKTVILKKVITAKYISRLILEMRSTIIS
jgi:hypothetical protein